VMDKMGLYHQFLPPNIRPLKSDLFLIGRAMTVLEADVCGNAEQQSKNPVLAKSFGFMLEALDDLRPGEIYICSGSSPDYALWGEIMSARAKKIGCSWRNCQWVFKGYNGYLGAGISLFFHGLLCAGSGTSWQGN